MLNEQKIIPRGPDAGRMAGVQTKKRVARTHDKFPQNKILASALECAEWQVNNQVMDRQDANRGRFIRSYDKASVENIWLGRNNKIFTDPLKQGMHNLKW